MEQPKQPQRVQATPSKGATDNAAPAIDWDDREMRSLYANVCNVSFTREEIVLLFGLSQAWQNGQSNVTVKVLDRVILGPFAAKRLHVLLGSVIRDFESRFGPLPVNTVADTAAPAAGAAAPPPRTAAGNTR